MSKRIPTWPNFSEDEIRRVGEVLRSGSVNYWTGGNCRKFETEFAKESDCRYGVAVSNGTVALELALRSVEVALGDEVIVSPRSFIASASCVPLVGAKPVFVDVDRETGNLSAANIAAALTPRTKAVIVVHLAGCPCEMDDIRSITESSGIRLIEDCAQAHGARYRESPVGSLGDVAAFSFCQDKIISTGGEGGMVVTNDEEIFEKVWSYKDHGKGYATVHKKNHPPGFRWLHESFGNNYRMTEIQAVIGLSQLERLDVMVKERRRFAAILDRHFRPLEAVFIPEIPAHIYHSYYRYYLYVKRDRLRAGWDRDRIISEFRARDYPGLSGSCSEIYLENAFQKSDHQVACSLPMAKELGEISVAFPVYPEFDQQYVEDMCEAVVGVIREGTK